jgi:DnaJ-class molecular chaperone
MQKVNAAKEILTDPEKRRMYDQYGLEGIQSNMGNNHFSGFSGFQDGGSQLDFN